MDSFLTERSVNVGARVEFCYSGAPVKCTQSRETTAGLVSLLHKCVGNEQERDRGPISRHLIIIIIGTYVNIEYNKITYRFSNYLSVKK